MTDAPDSTMEEKKEKSLRLVRYLSDHSDWESYDDTQELFVQGLPKIELHVHLDGSFDPDFLWKYMKENPDTLYCLPVQTHLPWDASKTLKVRELVQNCGESKKEFHKLCTCRGYRSLKEMLNCFEIFLPLVRRNLELLEQLAYDFCQRQYEQNVVYTEVRYSPFLLAEGYETEEEQEINAEAVFNAITRGLRRGSHKFGITINQIISAITWRPDWAMPTLALVQNNRNSYPCATVGIDIAAGEEHFNKQKHPELYEPHFKMIQRAKELELPITLHAGEATFQESIDNVRRAMDEYGASRIGHGYRVVEDHDLMAEVKQKNLHFEICPTSSVETGGWMYTDQNWREHPCLTMMKYGLPISFNSDDPAVFHTSLAWQYRIAMAKMGLTREDILKANLDAIDAAFCTDNMKEHLREMIHCYGVRKGLSLELKCECEEKYRPQWSRSMSDGFTDRVYMRKSAKGTEYVYS